MIRHSLPMMRSIAMLMDDVITAAAVLLNDDSS